MGNSVRFVIFEFFDRATTAAPAIGLARITFSLRKREMAQHGHDLMSCCSGVREETTKGLAEAMRSAIERKPAAVIASRIHPLYPSTVNGFTHTSAAAHRTACG